MKKYCLSKYLFFVELEGETLLFNGFTGNMDVVSNDFGAKLKSNPARSEVQFLSAGELEFMKRRGHVTGLSPADERAAFKKLVMEVHATALQKTERSGALMLLMSYGCNLSCPYCYQAGVRASRGPARMSEELLDSLFGKHYNVLFPGVESKDLKLSLYGGEPFLRANVPLIKRVVNFAERSNIRISAISNSTDLFGVRDFLGPLPGMISNVQVTLDTSIMGQGGARSKGRQFKEIINNIHFMLDRKVLVSIRMHVNGDNYQELSRVVDYLIDQDIAAHPFCYAYLAPIREHSDPAVKDQHLDLKRDIFREIGVKLGHPLNLEVHKLQALFSMRERRLSKTAFCMLGQANTYVADPFGDLYGCLEEAGNESVRIGCVDSDKVSFFEINEEYRKRNLCNLEKCLDCPFALLCGGGCGYHARRLRGSLLEPDCYNIKESLSEAIKYVYIKNNKAREIRRGA